MARRKKKTQDSKKRTKRNSSVLEYEIMKMIENCMKAAINSAMDELFKEWK